MHPFCRFCQSPTDRNIHLEEFGVERFEKWACINLGLKLRFIPGFSSSICWACVTTFRNWASMVAERAKHQGDDFLGNQPKWWNHLSCRKPWMKSDDETLEKNEIEDDYDGDAIECNPSIEGVATECSKNLKEPFESSFTPSVEAVFSIEGIKECSVKLPILKINFIEKCCKGLVDLSKYKPKPILIECIECNISFGNLLEKQQHFANVHPEYKSCPFCLKVFPPTTKLSNHLMEQNCCEDIPQLKLLCPKCHVSEYNYKKLFRHFNHVHKGPLPNQTHRCLSCNFVYFEKKQLDDHFKHSHKEHKCKKCAASFKSKVLAISHMALQHPDFRFGDFCKRVAGQPLQCFVCDAVFPRESRMAKHFLQYHPELMGTLEAPDVVLELAEQEEKCHTPTIKYDSNDSDDSAQKRFIPKDVPIERIVPGKRISTLTFHCPHCEKFFYKRFSLRKHVEQHLKNPKIPVVSTVSIEVSSKIQDQDSKPPTNLVISKPQPDTATKPMPLSCDKVNTPPLAREFPCIYCSRAPFSTMSQLVEHTRTSHFQSSKCAPPSKCESKSQKNTKVPPESCHEGAESCSSKKTSFEAEKAEPSTPKVERREKTIEQVKPVDSCINSLHDENKKDRCPVRPVSPDDLHFHRRKPKWMQISKSNQHETESHPGRGKKKQLEMKALKNKQKYKSTKRIQVATNCPGCGIFIGDAVFFKDHIAECSLVNPLVKTRVRCCPYEVLPDFKVAKCKSCNDHFPSMAAMYKHANNVHPETIHFKCSFCGFFFPSQKELDSHFTQMHERDSAVTKKLLARGTKSGTVISKKTCAINFLRASGKNLNSPTAQMRDASISTSKKVGRSESTISAPTLSSSFTISASKKAQEIDSRINGQNAHSDTSSFTNGQVTGSNRTPANLKPVKQGLIKCHQCTSVFESQLILNEHISLAHPPLRWHICFTCPDRPKFPSLSSLDAHIESGHSLDTTSSEGLVSRLPKMSTKQRVRSPKQKVSLVPTNLLKDDFRKAEKCQMCDFVSFSPETNQKHLEMFHPADQKSESLYCPLCNMTFVSKVVHLIHVSQCRGPRTKKSTKKLARKRRLCPSDEVGPSKSAPEPHVIDFRTHKTGNQESIVCDRVMKPVSPSSMKIRSLPNEDASTSSKSASVMPCHDASSDVQAKKPRMSNVDEQRQSAAETTAVVANAPCKRFPCYFCFSNLDSSSALIEHTKAMHNGVFVED